MRRAFSSLVLGVAISLAVGGCVSTEEVGGSNNATPTTTTLVPAVGALGTDVSYGGVLATVVDITPFDQSPKGFPRIRVVMRAENVSDSVQHNPDVALLCDETANVGDWFLGSTWEPNAVLPVNVVAQGEVIVGFPKKSDNPDYPLVTCSRPLLRLTIEGVRTDVPKVLVIPIDDGVIDEAIRRPRGPGLPLPPTGQ